MSFWIDLGRRLTLMTINIMAYKDCGGCGPEVGPSCVNAFARRGIRALHWECWSACNLSCPFCYRTHSDPVTGVDARRLVNIVSTSGARSLVFAGGDPSLRPDLPELCRLAKESGLNVEIQTNAHSRLPTIISALSFCDSIAVSIDAPVSFQHDEIRGARGNFRKVMSLIGKAEALDIPVRVRSVITNVVAEDWRLLGREISRHENVIEWRIQELSAVGQGLWVHSGLSVPSSHITRLAESLADEFPRLNCSYVSSASKVGLYAMARSDGQLYGTQGKLDSTGHYALAGNLLREHLCTLASDLGIDIPRHSARYA